MSDQRVVDDARALVDLLTLDGFRTLELAGRRRDAEPVPSSDEEFKASSDHTPKPPAELDGAPGKWTMQSFIRDDADSLAVRLRTTLESTALTEVVVDVAVKYAKTDEFQIEHEALEYFLRDVAVMQLFPYVRQSLSDLTGRLGSTVTLPMINRASIELSED